MPQFLTTQPGQVLQTPESGALSANTQFVTPAEIQQFDFSVNLLQAILWQYNTATNLQSLLAQKQAWYDENQEEFWDDWIADVFDLQTADEFGLVVWSIILGMPTFINTEPSTDQPTIGFDNLYFTNFNRGNFASQTGGTVTLPIETQRLALKLRYFQLITSGCVPEINRFLAYAFKDYGKVILRDNNDMTQLYVFLFTVTWDLAYLFDNLDILPRPAGVGSGWRDATEKVWGFGPFQVNYNRGNFAS